MWQRRPDSGTVARLRQRPNSCIRKSGDAPVLHSKRFQRFGRNHRGPKSQTPKPFAPMQRFPLPTVPCSATVRHPPDMLPNADSRPPPFVALCHHSYRFRSPGRTGLRRQTGTGTKKKRRPLPEPFPQARGTRRGHRTAAPGAQRPPGPAFMLPYSLLYNMPVVYVSRSFAFVRNARASARKASFLSPAFQKFESEIKSHNRQACDTIQLPQVWEHS